MGLFNRLDVNLLNMLWIGHVALWLVCRFIYDVGLGLLNDRWIPIGNGRSQFFLLFILAIGVGGNVLYVIQISVYQFLQILDLLTDA